VVCSSHVDILATRSNEDEEQQIIVVEAKCFSNPDKETTDLYTAIGQYMVYRKVLKSINPSLSIYLAVPTHAYHGIFKEIGMNLVRDENIRLIVINLETEEIEEWL
jgi:glucose-6-phosphate 1-dehydrogenase